MKLTHVDPIKHQSTHIEAVLDELLITNETDFAAKVQLYQKLVKECTALFETKEDAETAWQMTLVIHGEAKKAMQGRKHDFGNLSFQFETEMRTMINQKLLANKVM